jgi:hypothetical protein
MIEKNVSQGSGKVRPVMSYLLTAVVLSAFLATALQAELRLAVPLLVGSTAAVTAALAAALCFGERGELVWSPTVILSVALLLRLMFLFAPPQLSDDIYRYLWDGSALLRGSNPYAAAPSAVRPPPGLEAVHSMINHPDYVTIYPPAAQVVFAGGACLGGTITGLKTFLVLLDLGLCALIVALLRFVGLPPWTALLYAWNPLPVLEIAGSGHVDGAGLTLFLGSFCLLMTARRGAPDCESPRWSILLSGVLLAGSCLVKLFPLVLVPILFLLVPPSRRGHFVVSFLGALGALIYPFLPELTNMVDSLSLYARNWEFAGFAFTVLRTMTGSGTCARLILGACFLVVCVVIYLRQAYLIGRGITTVQAGRQALVSCYAIAMALLLLTPTLQPWYALCLAVFLPFCAGPAGLVLCWAVFLTYQVQIPYFILGQWTENPQVTAAVFLGPVTAFLVKRGTTGWGRARGSGTFA